MKIYKWVSLFLVINLSVAFGQSWRSSLYPANWTPGFSDKEGRFLHDFSYAGYHSGLDEIPNRKNNVIDVTKSPYNADKSGQADATEAIQKALDMAGKQGGGVVLLPEGEYKISVPENKKYGIIIRYSNVVLRGEGASKSFLKCITTNLRSKIVLLVAPENNNWSKPEDNAVALAKDVDQPTQRIPLQDVNSFKIGDRICITSDVTDEFAAEHGCLNFWKALRGPTFYREIKDIDKKNNSILIDVPTRYYLKTRDMARVYKIRVTLSESGLENFAIGNVQNAEQGFNDNEYNAPGTGAYQVHSSQVIELRNVENCWVKSVSTYKPAENTLDIHVLSNCLSLNNSRFVTVESCNFQKSQYNGEGGNGYMYCLMSNDCLLKNCYAENGRHNYDFKLMVSNGNVIYGCQSKDPRLASDFHMHLSMANLFDSFVADGDYLDASFRPYGSGGAMHMYSTTQSVFWNTIGLQKHKSSNYLIDSRQFGNGYVIGTSGKSSAVLTTPVSGIKGKIEFNTAPEDFTEGISKGETLVPQSLYLDQLEKRKVRIKNQAAKK
ncbi:MAG: hypothetical protein GZ091_10740 [Paludibacter sp.]|nr:hypothetical protein [Paludibacter sp.]